MRVVAIGLIAFTRIPVARQLVGPGVGHRRDRALRSAVVGLTEVAHLRSGHRVHDRSARALIAHPQRTLLRAPERAARVDPHHELPLVVGHLEEALVAHDPGVVHHRVDRTELVDALADELLRALARADVGAVRHGATARFADLADHLLRLFAVDVVHDDAGALRAQREAVPAADAAAAAGHHRGLAFEDAHLPPASWSSLAFGCCAKLASAHR
jgi:hypothetical protein